MDYLIVIRDAQGENHEPGTQSQQASSLTTLLPVFQCLRPHAPVRYGSFRETVNTFMRTNPLAANVCLQNLREVMLAKREVLEL